MYRDPNATSSHEWDLAEAVATAAGVPVDDVGEFEIVATEGDIDWYVVSLKDGRWAATDDAEVSPNRVTILASREEAIREQEQGWQCSYPGCALGEFPDPWDEAGD